MVNLPWRDPRFTNGIDYLRKDEGRESIEDELRSGRPSVSKPAENVVKSPGSCAFRSSLDSQNDWGRVEFESHHRSSEFDQLIADEKDLRQNGSEKPFSVNRFLASKNIPVAPQPPYSPDLSPCDIFLFPKLKNHLKGHHFGTLENIQTAVTDQLKSIPISAFHQCYEEKKKRLQRCETSEGSYFEGDKKSVSLFNLHTSYAD
ncbi:uncharacterized protein TNCV_4502021 [Trichonephila clavipes]|nr:uncharacterized protein TNCV_4502021 [Trichonephila clavipes]